MELIQLYADVNKERIVKFSHDFVQDTRTAFDPCACDLSIQNELLCVHHSILLISVCSQVFLQSSAAL